MFFREGMVSAPGSRRAKKIANVEHIEERQVVFQLLVNYGAVGSGKDKSYARKVDERLVVPVQQWFGAID